MNDTEKLEINPSALMQFWLKNKRWIYPTVIGLFALLGGNADRIDEWLPTADSNLTPRVVELETKYSKLEQSYNGLDSKVNTLTRVVTVHEEKLFPQGQPIKTDGANDQPVFRE